MVLKAESCHSPGLFNPFVGALCTMPSLLSSSPICFFFPLSNSVRILPIGCYKLLQGASCAPLHHLHPKWEFPLWDCSILAVPCMVSPSKAPGELGMGAEPQCAASQVVYGLSPQPLSLKALCFPLSKCFLQFVKMVRLYFILFFF